MRTVDDANGTIVVLVALNEFIVVLLLLMCDDGDRTDRLMALFTVNVSLYGLIDGELFKLIRFWYLALLKGAKSQQSK
jgi:hypothetical protein